MNFNMLSVTPSQLPRVHKSQTQKLTLSSEQHPPWFLTLKGGVQNTPAFLQKLEFSMVASLALSFLRYASPFPSLKSLDPLSCTSEKFTKKILNTQEYSVTNSQGVHHLIQYPPHPVFSIHTSTCLTPMNHFKENPKYHIIASVSIYELLKDTDLLEIFTDKK